MNTEQPMYKWNEIPWRKLERETFKLQKRIYKASSRGDVRTVHRLQKLLINSQSANCLAVRRVTQDNQGKKTAGVDGIKSLTPRQRLNLVEQLKLGSKVKPTRRVWIPKPGRDEKRPLGIPTMYDRALQALVKMALEPEWEAKFEPNSYGFRPGRSCHDAIQAIFITISQKPVWVLDADIAKCFDKINHEKLLEKLNTYPILRKQIRAWLKAGVMDGKELFPTLEGTPQGGVISPLLANIALHGMEEKIKEVAKHFEIHDRKGNLMSPSRKKRSISLIRYADDFVIMHSELPIITRCQEVISEWLKELGLELKPSKTSIVHSLNEYERKPGFDFLGFNIRQYKTGKYNSGKNESQETLGFKTIITPSKTSQKEHYQNIAQIIEQCKSQKQSEMIKRLNPIIRGWCNYYKIAGRKKEFFRLNFLIYKKLERWGRRRHQKKTGKWITNKYWHTFDNDRWVFSTERGLKLLKHGNTRIENHTKVKGNASPYDGNLTYWSTRMGKHPEMPKRTATLLKKQKGRCTHCGLFYKDGDIIELDHIIPKSKGGKDEYKNWQLLHRHCHDEKTRTDGSLERSGSKTGCNSAIPKQLSNIPSNYRWIDDMFVTTY